MNKLFSKIAALSVGLTLAIGVGVAVGGNTAKGAKATSASLSFGDVTGSASFTLDDSADNTWSITVTGTTSFTKNSAYLQIGSSKKPASKITLTTTLDTEYQISNFSSKWGGFSDTAGSVSMKVGTEEVATTSLSGTSDKTATQSTAKSGSVLTIEVTGIAKGVKLYQLSYDYQSSTQTTYTVSYDANLTAYTGNVPEDQTQASVGAAITVADALELEGYNWLGWNTSKDGGQDTRIAANSSYYPTKDTTLYGEWSEITVPYDKITDLAKADKVAITAVKSNVAYYLDASTNTTSAPAAKTFTISNNQATGIPASNLFTVSTDEDGNYIFTNASGDRLYTFNDNNGIRIGSTEDSYIVTATANGFKMQDTSKSRYVGVYSTTDWRSYTTSNASNYGGTGEAINFYGISKDLGDLTKIELSGEYPTEFKQGEDFSHEGMVVTATYSKGAEIDVTAQATFTGYDMATPGNQTVTVSYTDGETKTATYGIKVKASVALAAANFNMTVGDADVAPVVTIKDTTTVVEGCTFESKNTSVATVVNGKIHAVGRGTATITASHADDGDTIYTSVDFTVTVAKTDKIQDIYSMSANASVDTYGYYVGFLDGTGPVIMDGDYGIVIYNKTADVSSYEENVTVLHVTGSVSIYNGLYEIGSAAIDVPTSYPQDIAKGVVYTTTGNETQSQANRITNATGVVSSVVSGSLTADPAASDIKMNYTVGNKTFTVFYKRAAQNADDMATLKASLDGSKEITIKGFTSWYNGFQVQMNGIVEAKQDYTAEQFAQDLLDQTKSYCDNYEDGQSDYNAYKTYFTSVWSDLASADKYPSLPDDQKLLLAQAERDEEGTVIEQAMFRYDFLTGKYKLNNFINGRTPIASAINNLEFAAETDNSMIIIVSIAATTAVAFAALLIIKKKKHN